MSTMGAFHRVRQPARILLMCLIAFVGGWASTQLSLAVGTVSCIWVSNGIISAFVVTAPRRWKIPFFLVGQLSNLGTDLVLGNALTWAAWFVVCNSVEVLVTVLFLGHFEERAQVSTNRALARMALFGVVLGPLACALLASPAVRILEGRPLLEGMRIWFMADALGCAATLPLTLFLLTRPKVRSRDLHGRVADVAWGTALVTAGVTIFWQTKYPLIFMLFPPLVAILFRFRLAGAVYGTSLVVLFAAAFTAEGHGPFTLFPGAATTERVLIFQMFGLVMFASCIPLGFSIEERHRLEANLKKANQRLGDLALLDPLTGVSNRRSFDAVFESEWSSAHLSGEDLSLVFLDIDFFKRFNDTYGHQRGDDCLRSVAGALAASVRGAVDIVARYGGEEFVVLLPATRADSARATANRIASAILELQISHKESPFGVVTASIGVATVRPRLGGDARVLMRLADSACYAAKQSGRHRIESPRELELVSGFGPDVAASRQPLAYSLRALHESGKTANGPTPP
jgi:diguanylate cyclase (GGDEF)-like protein